MKYVFLIISLLPLANNNGQEIVHLPDLGINDNNVIFKKVKYERINIQYPKNISSALSPRFLPIHAFSDAIDNYLLFRFDYKKPYYDRQLLKYNDVREYYYYRSDSNIISKIYNNNYNNFVPLYFDGNKLIVCDTLNHNTFAINSLKSIEKYIINPIFINYFIYSKKCAYSPNRKYLLVFNNRVGMSDEIFILDSNGTKTYFGSYCSFAYWLSDTTIIYSKRVCNDNRLLAVTIYCLGVYNINTQMHYDIQSKWITNIYFVFNNGIQNIVYGERFGLPISTMNINIENLVIDYYYPNNNLKAAVNYFYPTKSGDFIGFLLMGHFPKFYLFKKLT